VLAAAQLLVGEENAYKYPDDHACLLDRCPGEDRAAQDHASEESSEEKFSDENRDDEACPDDH
jgi:hypothetical protein